MKFNGSTATYQYDAANRLIGLNNTESIGDLIAKYVLTLDRRGNRTRIQAETPINPKGVTLSQSYAYNPQRNRLVSDGSRTYSYDNEGQLQSVNDDRTFHFNERRNLSSISGNLNLAYVYDPLGNRLSRSEGGKETRFIYDSRGNLIAEADVDNAIQRYYIYGNGLLGMIESNGSSYNYHFDGIGNTVAITDRNENLVNRYAYTPFGKIANSIEIVEQPFTFVGVRTGDKGDTCSET